MKTVIEKLMATMMNGHQHHSSRRDQPTTTTIADNNRSAGSRHRYVLSPRYVVFFLSYPDFLTGFLDTNSLLSIYCT